jgi:hypothetical protein
MQPPAGIPLPALLLAQPPVPRAPPVRDAKAASEARRPGATGEGRPVGIGPGATALVAGARGGPVGQWLALLAADASARCGALRRSRTRAQRSCRDEQAAAAAAATATSRLSTAAAAAAEVTAHSAAARLFRHMDLALDEEVTALEAWLSTLDAAAGECATAGSSKFLQLIKAAPHAGSSAVTALAAAAAAIAEAAEAAAVAEKAAGTGARRGRSNASADAMVMDADDSVVMDAEAEADEYDTAAAEALAAAAGANEGAGGHALGSSGSPPSAGTDAEGGARVFSLEAAPQSLTCTGSPASAAARSAGTPAGSAGSEPNVFHQLLVSAVADAGCMDEALALDADSAHLAVLTGLPWAASAAC